MRNGAAQRIFEIGNIGLTPSRWASPLVLWFICGPRAGLICSPPPSTQMHAHSIFMLTPYISHVCCTHREEVGGGGALPQACDEIESRGRRVNGFAGAAGRRRDFSAPVVQHSDGLNGTTTTRIQRPLRLIRFPDSSGCARAHSGLPESVHVLHTDPSKAMTHISTRYFLFLHAVN